MKAAILLLVGLFCLACTLTSGAAIMPTSAPAPTTTSAPPTQAATPTRATVTSSPTAPPARCSVATSVLTLRAGPGASYRAVGWLQEGEAITPTGTTSGAWWEVRGGWLYSKYANCERENP